jgi:glutathione S-transferase
MGVCVSKGVQGAKAPTGSVKVYGLPVSANCVGPVLLAMDTGAGQMEQCNIMEGAHKTDAMIKINPFTQIPSMSDGQVRLAESMAILRYVANKYAPQLYGGADADAKATIDWALDWSSSFMYPAFQEVCYPVLGFNQRSEGQIAAGAAKLTEVTEQFCAKFLTGKFVGGNSLSIADYRIAPFYFVACHAAVGKKTPYKPSARIERYVKDFEAASKSSGVFLHTLGGFSLDEYLKTKM